MDNLPETYNDPQFYMTIVSNFSWVLQSGPKRGRGQWLCLFFFFLFFWRGRGGGVQNMDCGLGENSKYGQNELG